MSLNGLKIVKYKIITAVLPQHVSPFLRNYHDLRSHPHSVTVRSVPITTEYPQLPRYYRDPHPHAALYDVSTWTLSPTISYLLGILIHYIMGQKVYPCLECVKLLLCLPY